MLPSPTSKQIDSSRVLLLSKMRRGDERVSSEFEKLIHRDYEALVRRLTLILHNHEEAKDIAQETFLRAFRAWGSFDGRDGRAWLFTIGIRLAYNSVRRRRWLVWRHFDGPAAESWQPTERVELWEALAALPAMHRAAILLNLVDGYTQVEVAKMLGVPAGTVASWIAQSKAVLREAVGELGR
jgi:RNA polymerase sigma-70 factor, ECF subfamily